MYTRRLFIFFFSSLVLLSATLLVKPSPPSSESEKAFFWTNKVFNQSNIDAIMIGDSRTYRRLNPTIFDSTLKMKFFNFGFNAGGINLQILKAGLQRLKGQKNTLIVLGITPSSLLSKSQKNTHYMQERSIGWSEKLVHKFVSPKLKIFDPVHPGYVYNSVLGRKIGYFEVFQANGFVASERIPPDTTIAIYNYLRLFENDHIQQADLDTLIKVLDYARELGIQIVGWRPKGSYTLTQIEDSLSGYDESQVQQIIESCGGKWLDTPIPEATYDGSHVPMWVAQDFSRNFALQLKQVLKSRSPQNN